MGKQSREFHLEDLIISVASIEDLITMKKNTSKQQIRDGLKTSAADRLRFIEENKNFLKKIWNTKTIEIVEKLRRHGY